MAILKWTKVFVLAVAVVGLSVNVYGQGRGNGNGGGGGPGEEVGKNLSVPAIFIAGGQQDFGITSETAIEPTGVPLSGYPIDPSSYYYVQGVHQWQASAIFLESGVQPVVFGRWGDNLTGEASLTTKKPIRVEIGFHADPMAYQEDYELTGWNVLKLEPLKLDREAAYGIDADSDPFDPYPELRVYDPSTWLKIYNIDTPEDPVVDELASAEINSTGRIVYGYNLRVATPGTYVIEFTPLFVNLDEALPGEVDGQTAKLEIEVKLNKGNGGGGGNRR